jgi:hypothetical protein
LAGVHRPRLFAQHLASFGWEPTVLTVHEKYYEETPDWDLVKLLPEGLRLVKVRSFAITKPRVFGDIGLRGFFQLYARAKSLVKKERFNFLLIPIPSFYCALLGRWLHSSTGIKYGIDYIDPWVHNFPGSHHWFSRHWFSTKLAQVLEPIAVKKASLITGVAEGYFKAVLERNPHLKTQVISGAMPYGGEEKDYLILRKLDISPYLFHSNGKFQMVYAGAMLPKAFDVLELILQNIANNLTVFKNVEFHFIGTGKTADDAEGFNVKPLAEKYGLWKKVIFEYPQRISYLDVLVHLNVADAVFLLGSTEPHYTPSKTYQGVMSGKPILGILHEESTAVGIIRNSRAGSVLTFNGKFELNTIGDEFVSFFVKFLGYASTYNVAQVDMVEFEKYSAKNVTSQLANLLNQALNRESVS